MDLFNSSHSEKNILSVSQLNRKAKQLLETHLPLIWVSGELSNLAQPGSGHWYFSLKDENAQVRCAMFRNANARVRWQPQSGQQVLVRARVSLYEGRGDYQLIVEHMDAAGAGQLQQAYEDLKQKLEAEGLFDQSAKQALPLFPRHIGLITSATGAAIHDILSVLQRRYPIAPVTVLAVAVQGDSAAPEIIAAIDNAQHFGKCDVLIIARGGGSLEDLWAFNNERLARAIAACTIPVVSAVGHEVDFTICDYVADLRAPTPSASAELITPDLPEWQQTLDLWQQQLVQRQHARIQQKQQQLRFLKKRLRHPKESLQLQQQRLAIVRQRLAHSIRNQLHSLSQALEKTQQKLWRQHPQQRLQALQETLLSLRHRANTALTHQLERKQQAIAAKAQLLNAVSPLAVLARGFSITSDQTGKPISELADVHRDSTLSTRLLDGTIKSKVTDVIAH
ncbi:MAG: exodeoxyribonuclease VII large subunit [Pseudomonadota bacterium]